MSCIVLTGGGSAGHCSPCLALIPYLKKYYSEIYYIGSKNGIEKDLVSKSGIKYYSINTTKLIRSFNVKNLFIPIKLTQGVFEAWKILKKLRPNVVFSKGGYVSLPVVLASHNLKIPIVTHESDLSIGLTNKIACKYSEKILTSFRETAMQLNRGEYVGSPIKDEIFYSNKVRALEYFNFTSNKPIILVMGGSLGATSINSAIRSSLDKLLTKYQILHICGKGNVDLSILKQGYMQVEFINMGLAYSVADIAISRAGANSLFELLALKIPSIIIPLPKGASRGDQILNAKYFCDKKLFIYLDQQNLTKREIINKIDYLFNNIDFYREKLQQYKYSNPNEKIVQIIRSCESS